jgi:hypothetical protein
LIPTEIVFLDFNKKSRSIIFLNVLSDELGIMSKYNFHLTLQIGATVESNFSFPHVQSTSTHLERVAEGSVSGQPNAVSQINNTDNISLGLPMSSAEALFKKHIGLYWHGREGGGGYKQIPAHRCAALLSLAMRAPNHEVTLYTDSLLKAQAIIHGDLHLRTPFAPNGASLGIGPGPGDLSGLPFSHSVANVKPPEEIFQHKKNHLEINLLSMAYDIVSFDTSDHFIDSCPQGTRSNKGYYSDIFRYAFILNCVDKFPNDEAFYIDIDSADGYRQSEAYQILEGQETLFNHWLAETHWKKGEAYWAKDYLANNNYSASTLKNMEQTREEVKKYQSLDRQYARLGHIMGQKINPSGVFLSGETGQDFIGCAGKNLHKSLQYLDMFNENGEDKFKKLALKVFENVVSSYLPKNLSRKKVAVDLGSFIDEARVGLTLNRENDIGDSDGNSNASKYSTIHTQSAGDICVEGRVVREKILARLERQMWHYIGRETAKRDTSSSSDTDLRRERLLQYSRKFGRDKNNVLSGEHLSKARQRVFNDTGPTVMYQVMFDKNKEKAEWEWLHNESFINQKEDNAYYFFETFSDSLGVGSDSSWH